MCDYVSFSVKKVSANPIAPEEEIDAVVQQVPEVQQQRKTVSFTGGIQKSGCGSSCP
jgi:hypothetical protein